LLLPLLAQAVTLEDVYATAPPMAGYDRVLMLESGEVYTGGIVILDENIAIWGNGASVDLQTGSVIAMGNGNLDIDGCVFMNGDIAVSVSDDVRTNISNCVFYNNNRGIQHYSSLGAPLIVYNTIFMNNRNYAVYTSEENLTYMLYNVAYNNAAGHFVAGCGS